jgi:hypothetical protein
MSKSWGDWLSDQIAMLPLHLTGISAIAKAIDVTSDVAGGKTPKASDVVGAAGLIDADGLDSGGMEGAEPTDKEG